MVLIMKRKSEQRFDAIKHYIFEFHKQNHGYLSVRQIALGTGIPFPSVQRYIHDLKDSGEVIVDSTFGIGVFETEKITKDFATVGLLGSIVCSEPSEPEFVYDEYFKLPPSLVGSGEFFFLRAKGDSMIKAGIKQGDFVLVRHQSTAEPGQIVVALLGESTTLKRYYPQIDRVVLHPENDDTLNFPDIIINGSDLLDFSIQGIAVKVLSDIS